jgi:hypothetical protein
MELGYTAPETFPSSPSPQLHKRSSFSSFAIDDFAAFFEGNHGTGAHWKSALAWTKSLVSDSYCSPYLSFFH